MLFGKKDVTNRIAFPSALPVALILALVLAFAVTAGPAQAQNVDNDGCYGAGQCVQMSGEWNGDAFTSRYTNNCPQRIYIRFCNYRDTYSSDYDDCGADGLSPGHTKNWTTYGGKATGYYEAEWVGSLYGGKDWVCAGRVSGWNSFGR